MTKKNINQARAIDQLTLKQYIVKCYDYNSDLMNVVRLSVTSPLNAAKAVWAKNPHGYRSYWECMVVENSNTKETTFYPQDLRVKGKR